MKTKYLLLPYLIIIVVIPALISHLARPLRLNAALLETGMDILMVITAAVGLILTITKKKSRFRGWIPLLALLLLVLLPQLYLWKSQKRGFTELRTIYRFALLYITLFAVPLEIHFHRHELCRLIGGFCLFGFGCCLYELYQHPRIWEAMSFFSGKEGQVQSFFDNTNRFGAYCALWFILCLFAFELSRNKLWFLSAGFFGFFLVCTWSRGGIMLAILFCLGYLISCRRRLGTKTLLMLLADILIVLAVLFIIPTTRRFMISLIGLDAGVSGRDRIWSEAWKFYLEGNPLFGHGLGTQIERIMIERLSTNVNTHNMYLYLLICGGITLFAFYVLSLVMLFRRGRYRHHFLIPFLCAFLVYGFFEMAGSPFDYWHLSNLFTICLFTLPALAGRDGIHSGTHTHQGQLQNNN